MNATTEHTNGNATKPSHKIKYKPSLLSQSLHSLPHLDSQLRRIDNTCAPNSPDYITSLFILAAVPCIWLILTLIISLIYFVIRWNELNEEPPESTFKLKVSLAVLLVLCFCSVGVGLIGNRSLHKAIMRCIHQGNSIGGRAIDIIKQMNIIKEAMGPGIRFALGQLSDIVESPLINTFGLGGIRDSLSDFRENAQKAVDAAEQIKAPLIQMELDHYLQTVKKWEKWRWKGFTIAWCVLCCVCVALCCAAAWMWRWALLPLCVAAVGAIVACWLAASIFTFIAVGAADACQDPVGTIVALAPGVPKEIIHHFLVCNSSPENDTNSEIYKIKQALDTVRQTFTVLSVITSGLKVLSVLAEPLNSLHNSTKSAEMAVASLSSGLDCQMFAAAFTASARFSCIDGLRSLTLLLIAAILNGLILSGAMLVSLHIWIYTRYKQDESDILYKCGPHRKDDLLRPVGPLSYRRHCLSSCH